MQPPKNRIYKANLKMIEFLIDIYYCFVSGFAKITFIIFFVCLIFPVL
jgi:hypothetical protein